MNLKQMVGIEAASYIEDGMIVGLGTGSTAYYMVEELGRRIKEENLSVVGVTTSEATRQQAEGLGIPLKSIDEVPHVDLTIDGADEVNPQFEGIKGGGAALLFEKIVATYSRHNIWIVDESKWVEQLGAFPLPVEVMPYGSQQLVHLFEKEGLNPVLRVDADNNPIVTDGKHYIIDLHCQVIAEPRRLADWLNSLPGVVEHGLFLSIVDTVIIGKESGIETIQKHAN
ncbi:ribose 5-phosphate isomerase A [Vagococcus lutrae LBD1]|uniref:Ribose-5-phosphate isomerase A n=1 Tax=Vagococcus lutrae LBD1 TaxID=1408226 RepID=V6Q3G8_9ENTE|nr:ribose-5-phosphate isomerase RpiA [Vagococcus lutrae]EST89200.1 ribose 5-phosphate isomerase A [Vagococcus lutrae LBD1]